MVLRGITLRNHFRFQMTPSFVRSAPVEQRFWSAEGSGSEVTKRSGSKDEVAHVESLEPSDLK